jgi:hypothetical protein
MWLGKAGKKELTDLELAVTIGVSDHFIPVQVDMLLACEEVLHLLPEADSVHINAGDLSALDLECGDHFKIL